MISRHHPEPQVANGGESSSVMTGVFFSALAIAG